MKCRANALITNGIGMSAYSVYISSMVLKPLSICCCLRARIYRYAQGLMRDEVRGNVVYDPTWTECYYQAEHLHRDDRWPQLAFSKGSSHRFLLRVRSAAVKGLRSCHTFSVPLQSARQLRTGLTAAITHSNKNHTGIKALYHIGSACLPGLPIQWCGLV